MQNRTANDRVKGGFRIGQRIRILHLVLNIWRGIVRLGDLQKFGRDVNSNDTGTRTSQFSSERTRAASKLEDGHPWLQMTGKHPHPPCPAKFPGRALPVPNLPCAVLCEEAPVFNFFGNAFLHWKILRCDPQARTDLSASRLKI